MNPSEPLRFPRPASPRPTEAYESLLAAQVAMAGQVWKANSQTAEFVAGRLRKDAALVATLATTRMPTAAARLMLAHMQDTFADYGDQAMRFGAMFRVPAGPSDADRAMSTATPPSDLSAQDPVPAPARAAATGKPHRSIPV